MARHSVPVPSVETIIRDATLQTANIAPENSQHHAIMRTKGASLDSPSHRQKRSLSEPRPWKSGHDMQNSREQAF